MLSQVESLDGALKTSMSPCLLPELSLVRAIHYRPTRDTSSPVHYLTAHMNIASSQEQGELPVLLLKKRSNMAASVFEELITSRSSQDSSSRLIQRLIYDSISAA